LIGPERLSITDPAVVTEAIGTGVGNTAITGIGTGLQSILSPLFDTGGFTGNIGEKRLDLTSLTAGGAVGWHPGS